MKNDNTTCKSEIRLTKNEIEAIKLVDIDNLKIKNCAKKMNLSVDDFEKLLKSARYKIAKEMYDKNIINIIEEKEQPTDDTLYIFFRCAVCGTIYKLTGKEESVQCPMCLSNKIMDVKEAGFCKKNYWS
ncbi:DUF134 domain-containing protein [Paraclostridium bifermentans]|uniref:DUF134 domain-containing protein n=1 Tax=Paraclostridium bifermentans TaxID=1490 RepID=UPI00359CA7C1